MICIGCGCSEFNPCIDESGERCSWVECDEGPLCSFCAYFAARERMERGLPPLDGDGELLSDGGEPEPLVQLASDAECSAFLRARRAGA